jgi:4-amino-4-deoxy-L-arabinose transferase-like glycosyltransferase
VAAVAALTALALVLRLHDFGRVPLFMDNADEINFAWGGLNLILHGDAYTWSYLHAYGPPVHVAGYGTTFPLVHHWLDHPPLFALIIGGWVWVAGVRDMFAVTPEAVRFLPVLFSTATVPLIQLLGRRFLDWRAALVGAALLAVAPGAVLLGRVAEAESLLAPILLVALLLTHQLLREPGSRWALAGLLACGVVSPLLKVPGIAVAGICAVILLCSGRWRLAGVVGASAVAGVLLYVSWGALIDWNLFKAVWAEQAGKRTGVMSGFEFITTWSGINRQLRDGWWLLGWLGLAVLAARGGETAGGPGSSQSPGGGEYPPTTSRREWELFLAWPAIAYSAVMLVLANEAQAAQYGWYRVIIYPEVYLAAGWLAWEAVRNRSLTLLTIVLVAGGATATNWWLGGPDAAWVPNAVVLSLVMAAILAPTVLLAWRRRGANLEPLALAVGGGAMAVMALGNLVESWSLNSVFFRL